MLEKDYNSYKIVLQSVDLPHHTPHYLEDNVMENGRRKIPLYNQIFVHGREIGIKAKFYISRSKDSFSFTKYTEFFLHYYYSIIERKGHQEAPISEN